jgi:hypothetical protein
MIKRPNEGIKGLNKVKSLGEKIQAQNDELKRLFSEKGDVVKIAEFFKKMDAVLVTDRYERMPGGNSAQFWARFTDPRTTLEVETVNICFGTGLGVFEKPDKKKYNTVAVIVRLISIKASPQKSVAYWISADSHQEQCPWGDGDQ